MGADGEKQSYGASIALHLNFRNFFCKKQLTKDEFQTNRNTQIPNVTCANFGISSSALGNLFVIGNWILEFYF